MQVKASDETCLLVIERNDMLIYVVVHMFCRHSCYRLEYCLQSFMF